MFTSSSLATNMVDQMSIKYFTVFLSSSCIKMLRKLFDVTNLLTSKDKGNKATDTSKGFGRRVHIRYSKLYDSFNCFVFVKARDCKKDISPPKKTWIFVDCVLQTHEFCRGAPLAGSLFWRWDLIIYENQPRADYGVRLEDSTFSYIKPHAKLVSQLQASTPPSSSCKLDCWVPNEEQKSWVTTPSHL